jgi:hypothetical protein
VRYRPQLADDARYDVAVVNTDANVDVEEAVGVEDLVEHSRPSLVLLRAIGRLGR